LISQQKGLVTLPWLNKMRRQDSTKGYEDRGHNVDYCKFLGIALDMGPIGNPIRLHERTEKQ
jgi:hypothetical protein